MPALYLLPTSSDTPSLAHMASLDDMQRRAVMNAVASGSLDLDEAMRLVEAFLEVETRDATLDSDEGPPVVIGSQGGGGNNSSSISSSSGGGEVHAEETDSSASTLPSAAVTAAPEADAERRAHINSNDRNSGDHSHTSHDSQLLHHDHQQQHQQHQQQHQQHHQQRLGSVPSTSTV